MLVDAKANHLDIEPSTAEKELDRLAREVISQPPEIVAKMKRLFGEIETALRKSPKGVLRYDHTKEKSAFAEQNEP